jgi:hypothetical protein
MAAMSQGPLEAVAFPLMSKEFNIIITCCHQLFMLYFDLFGGMVAFRMAEMYPNFVKKMMISSSGVGFVLTSLDELLCQEQSV